MTRPAARLLIGATARRREKSTCPLSWAPRMDAAMLDPDVAKAGPLHTGDNRAGRRHDIGRSPAWRGPGARYETAARWPRANLAAGGAAPCPRPVQRRAGPPAPGPPSRRRIRRGPRWFGCTARPGSWSERRTQRALTATRARAGTRALPGGCSGPRQAAARTCPRRPPSRQPGGQVSAEATCPT